MVPTRRGNSTRGNPEEGRRRRVAELLGGNRAGASEPDNVSRKQQRIAELAKQSPQMGLLSLNHHLELGWMLEAYNRTRKDGAPGVDGQTDADYGLTLLANLESAPPPESFDFLGFTHSWSQSQEGELGGEAEDGRQPIPSCGQEDRRLVPVEPPPAVGEADRDTGIEAEGALCVLRRRVGQPALPAALSSPGGASMAKVAGAAETARPVQLGADEQVAEGDSAASPVLAGVTARSEPVT